jgi:hypothetical protein
VLPDPSLSPGRSGRAVAPAVSRLGNLDVQARSHHSTHRGTSSSDCVPDHLDASCDQPMAVTAWRAASSGKVTAPRRSLDIETPPDRRLTRPDLSFGTMMSRPTRDRGPRAAEGCRRLQAAELVPRSASLLGISSHETGRAHQWLGAGPVAAVWPACLSLPSIVLVMAHDTPLSSANCTDTRQRGLLLVPVVTAPCGRNRAN